MSVKCAKDLIGSLALRATAVVNPDGTFDNSYTYGQPVKIVNVTDWHVYIETVDDAGKVYALDKRFLYGWVEWCPTPIVGM